jgi:hypothetical protein
LGKPYVSLKLTKNIPRKCDGEGQRQREEFSQCRQRAVRDQDGTHRSAKSGEFVSAAYAAKHSETRVQDNKLEQIEKSIAALSDQELKELAAWFDELRWERWDRQLEDDVKAGRLDKLIGDAKAEIAAGKTRPL